METLNNKITGSNLTAAEWNQVPSELQNVITDTGQTLTNADLNQLGKGIAQYASNGDFYTDSGAANAYVLTQIGTKQAPTSYVDGLVIRFLPGNTNTSASTVNVASLGVKTIVNFNGIALVGDEIVSGDPVRAFFDLGNDRFQLLLEIGANNYSLLRTGRRNALINAGFDIFQRQSTASVNGFVVDRWAVEAVAASTMFFSLNSQIRGQPDVPQEPRFFLRNAFVGGGGVGDAVLMRQSIEDVRTLAGEIVTVQFYARSPTSLDISIEMFQNFGSGGSSSVSAIGVTKFTLTPTFTRFTSTFLVNSIVGQTVGTSSALELIVWFDAGSNFDARTDSLGSQTGEIDLSSMQVERGAEATDFEKLHIEEIFQLCLRYFEKITYITSDLLTTAQCVTTSQISGVLYYAEKRIAPSISVPVGTVVATTADGSNGGGALSASHQNIQHSRLTMTGASGLVVGNASTFLTLNPTDLFIDSEI